MWNKFTRGEALIDVVIGTTLIGFFVISTFNVLLGILKESGQITKRIQANWVANSYMEQITHFPFTDPDDIDPEDGSDRDDVDDFDDYSVVNYGLTVTVNVNDAEVNEGIISLPDSPLDNPDFKQVRVTISDGGLSEPIELKTLVALDQLPPILESIRLSETYNADGEGDFLFDERVFSSAESEMSIIATFTGPVTKSGGADSDITMTLTNIRETRRDNENSPFTQSDEDVDVEAVLVSNGGLELEPNQLEFQLSLFHPGNPDGDVEGNSHYSSPDLETFVAVASINYGNDLARLVAKDDLGQPQVSFEAVLDLPGEENNLMEDKALIFLPPLETPIFTDYDLFIEEVNANEPPPTFADIFNTWPRFVDQSGYYVYNSSLGGCDPNGTQNEIENNCFSPALHSKAKKWDLMNVGQENERIEMQENTWGNMVGIVNPNPIDDFSLSATLWGGNTSDNDLIAIVIAFVNDGSKNYYISAQFTRNGTDPCNWALVAGEPRPHSHNNCDYLSDQSWLPGIWGELMIPQNPDMTTNSNRPNWNDNLDPSFTRVKVTRKGNIITAETNGWVGVKQNINTSRTDAIETAYLDQTYIRLDLKTAIATDKDGGVISNQNSINADYLEKFLTSEAEPCCGYGYAAFSQQGSTFYDIEGGEVRGAFGQWIYLGHQIVDPTLLENYAILGIPNEDTGHFSLWDSFATEGPDADQVAWLNANVGNSQIWFFNEDANEWQFSPTVNTVQEKLGWMRIVTSAVGEPTQDSEKKSFLLLEENER